MSFTSPEQPVQGQDQPVAPDPTPAAVAPAPVAPIPAANPGPWAQDLNAIFQDETTRGVADQFLRERVQPRMTQLEQQVAQSRDAVKLYSDFNEQPIDTYVSVTEELFGAEHAQELLGFLQQRLEAGQQPPATQQLAQQPQAPNDPRLDSIIQWAEQKQQSEWYDGEITRIQADPQFADVKPELLHPFVVAANGDFNQAIEQYRWYAQQYQQANVAPVAPAEVAPNVMGSDTATVTAPPTQPQRETLTEAIEGFVRDSRASAAPPVGTA